MANLFFDKFYLFMSYPQSVIGNQFPIMLQTTPEL